MKKVNSLVKSSFKKTKVALQQLSRVATKKSTLINLNIITTNLCNQHCPMCNTTLMRDQKNFFTLEIFNRYIKILKSYHLASCTISGGEPTLAKELPLILDVVKPYFPFGVLLITNLYGNTKHVLHCMEVALKNDINLSISFDGFGKTADTLRGAKNVSDRSLKHIQMLHELQQSIQSKSTITIHTVVSNLNLPQVHEIFDFSKKLGWNQTIAPVNVFYYQNKADFSSSLSLSQGLLDVCERALEEKHVKLLDAYIQGMALYTQFKAPKLCPYESKTFQTYKFFLEPNGDLSLCDRVPIGNINHQHVDQMIQSQVYEKSLSDFKKCQGCWLGCFVEPKLRTQASVRKNIQSLYDQTKKSISNSNSFNFQQLENLPSKSILSQF